MNLTWQDIIEMGTGEMNLCPFSVMDMTADEFSAAVRGFRRRQEWEQQQEWERIRWLGSITLQPHLKKGSKMKPTDLVTFPWEEVKEQKPVDALAILHAYGTQVERKKEQQ